MYSPAACTFIINEKKRKNYVKGKEREKNEPILVTSSILLSFCSVLFIQIHFHSSSKKEQGKERWWRYPPWSFSYYFIMFPVYLLRSSVLYYTRQDLFLCTYRVTERIINEFACACFSALSVVDWVLQLVAATKYTIWDNDKLYNMTIVCSLILVLLKLHPRIIFLPKKVMILVY